VTFGGELVGGLRFKGQEKAPHEGGARRRAGRFRRHGRRYSVLSHASPLFEEIPIFKAATWVKPLEPIIRMHCLTLETRDSASEMFPADDILIARGKHATLRKERREQLERVRGICTMLITEAQAALRDCEKVPPQSLENLKSARERLMTVGRRT
jgi:hypothetical protein